MKRMLLLLAAASLLTCLGCRTENSRPADTLRNLRASLDLVKKAPADKPFTAPCPAVSALPGLSREQIKAALGTPHLCGPDWAPFAHEGDWFYSLYKLPNTMVGGGPELVLQFGRGDICTSATWVNTQ